MEAAEYEKMFAYEDAHWWFRGKRAVIARVLDRFGAPARGAQSLDVGCGTGANLVLLEGRGPAYGVDLSPLALERCRRRGLRRLARAAADRLPYRADRFDIVTLLDVLYHRRVEDVRAALTEAYRVCRPGGLLVITDSAFEALRGPHDVAYHTGRRFRRRALAGEVAASGFTVRQSSYMNTLLFPIALAVRLLERRRGADRTQSDLSQPPALVNGALATIYGLEARLLGYTSLPVGLSVLIVAEKPR